jgi:primosomal protein N' (replication factor Y)
MSEENRQRYVDVVFPQNVNRLTYKLPSHLAKSCIPGSVAGAPVRGTIKYGIVIKLYDTVPDPKIRKKLKSITDISDTFAFSKHLLKLLSWVSDYYMCNEGLALKGLILAAVLKELKRRHTIKKEPVDHPAITLPDLSQVIKKVDGFIAEKKFQALLFHTKTIHKELSLILGIIRNNRKCLLIVPERHDLSYVTPFLEIHARERYCLLHGSMSRSAKEDAYEGIYSGRYDVVVGTMQTVFAPISNPSVIIVFKEHSEYYKHEETPMYNVRDVAVKRGSLENIPVLLTSISPSFESYYNQTKGKYILLEDKPEIDIPPARIINAGGSDTILTTPLKKSIKEVLGEGKDVLLVLNRKGHSILQCKECGSIEICPHCDVPLVYHTEKILRCHYCGLENIPPDLCQKCGSTDLKSLGFGTEKIFQMLKEEFDRDIVLIDKEHPDASFEGNSRPKIIIGTELALRRIKPFKQFGLIGLLNCDVSLHRPDFRVYERLFQDISFLSQFSDNSRAVFIQSYDWSNPFFSFVKRYDYQGFFKSELPKRKAFHYPPFSKLALLSIKSSAYNEGCHVKSDKEIEILGPIYKTTGKNKTVEFLIKCRMNVAIQKYINRIAGTITDSPKDLKIDIDPLMSG